MKDVVTLLLEKRPEDPVVFIAEYFRNVLHGSNPLLRAYRFLSMTDLEKETFLEGLASAYVSLDWKKDGAGVTLAQFRKLAGMLSKDFPPELATVVVEVMGKSTEESIDFGQFVAGVRALLLLQEFLQASSRIFRSCCDSDGSETVALESFMKRLASVEDDASVGQLPPMDALRSELSRRAPSGMIAFNTFLLSVFQVMDIVP
eukprot:PLAT13633.1.p1 GENE.PLAT13633.1~~PLAT13633.1.p1  ORF type:complete len:227 (+),score=59.52 PLAT13633.1:73-681(+)